MSSAMANLALVKILADSSKSYFGSFIPFVGECLRTSGQDVVALGDLQEAIRRRFRLDIPQHALDLILSRARRKGYIRKENHVYHKVVENLDSSGFSLKQEDLLSKYDRFLQSFRSFAENRYGYSLSDQEAEETVLSYLDEYGIEIVTSATRQVPPILKGERFKSKRYVLSAYIQHCYETGQPEFYYFGLAAKGLMLANALFLPHPDRIEKKFKKTDVYLDTTILIYSLGYAGEPRRETYQEMLELGYESGANLRCFRHTYEETKGVLDTCVEILKSGRTAEAYGPTMDFILMEGKAISDV
jgi:hypothetical protein